MVAMEYIPTAYGNFIDIDGTLEVTVVCTDVLLALWH